jgi:rhodanese-related sulfurtransferase
MRKVSLVLVLSFGLVGLLSACGGGEKAAETAGETEQAEATTGYTDISAQQLNEMMQNKDFLLINVHIPYAGDIPGTDLSIPYNEIQENLDKLPEDKESKLVIYCRSGHMSVTAAKELAGLGYKNVYNLVGGMKAWKSAGFELVEKES